MPEEQPLHHEPYYAKRKGRYYPVGALIYDGLARSFPEGTYILTVRVDPSRHGMSVTKRDVELDELTDAAIITLATDLCDMISFTPYKLEFEKKISDKKMQEALKMIEEKVGSKIKCLWYPSKYDAIHKAAERLIQRNKEKAKAKGEKKK